MSRQNTQLESAGVEFLVLGHLMVEGIPSFKSYTNTKGYDLISTNPEKDRSVRIQVKSRYRTKAEGFIINDFGCDFVVIVLLNRGDKHGKVAPSDPDYYVVPVDIVKAPPRTSRGGGAKSASRNSQTCDPISGAGISFVQVWMPMTDRRRIILADARRRFRDGQRLGLGWTWSQCLRTAAQADRIRRNEPRAMLAEAAAQIRAHVEIATPPGRLTGSSERAFERGRRRPTLDG